MSQPPQAAHRTWTTSTISRFVNQPLVTICSIAIAVALGLSHWPIVNQLRPIGDIYLALLQMSVLPFLLAAIPLAMRSAIAQGAAGSLLGRLLAWLAIAFVLVAAGGTFVSTIAFKLVPISEAASVAVGGIVGGASGRVDLEFVMDAGEAAKSAGASGNIVSLVSLVPSNIFAALSSNEITGVLVFMVIFGLSMAVNERRTGNSFFPELKHLHDVCLLVFEWLNVFVPLGIIALIAPQVSQTGPEIFLILADFLALFLVLSGVLIGLSIVAIALSLGLSIRQTFVAMLKPLSLAAATRNTIACVPMAVEVLTNELHVSRAGCELFVPLGFTVLRFGNILHFAVSAIFIGTLVGRGFGAGDIMLIGLLAIVASFGTIGLSGAAGLSALAAVLRPFALSYELALPILIVVDPIISMLRAMLNVAIVAAITALGAGRQIKDDAYLTPPDSVVLAG